jgi:hypothetical protein
MNTIPFRGYVSSADLSSGAEIPLYDTEGVAITVAATDVIHIYSLTMAGSGSVTYTVFGDADDDNAVDTGEVVAVLRTQASVVPFNHAAYPRPVAVARGSKLHVISSGAGQADLTVTGHIERP